MELYEFIIENKIFYILQDKCFFFLLTNRQWEAGNGSQKDDGEQTAAKLFNMMITLVLTKNNPLVEKTVRLFSILSVSFCSCISYTNSLKGFSWLLRVK